MATPRRILAVRGRLTKDQLETRLGLTVPPVFGDPALLLPHFFSPAPAGSDARIGLVLHYSHRKFLPKDPLDDVLQIDVREEPEEVLSQIAGVRCVVSSSLHGIICAQAYGIPWVWLKFPDAALMGGTFKFLDFLSTMDGRTPDQQVSAPSAALSGADIRKFAQGARLAKGPKLTPLMDCFPF